MCSECGADVASREACAALYDQLTYQVFENVRIASVLTVAFDTYCMQHVETYCVSAKSYVAHLTRLCVGVEYGGKQEIYAALQCSYRGGLNKTKVLTH